MNDPAVAPAVRVNMLRLLAAAALKDDVILLLHQDRRDHVMMNFAQEVDRHTPDEQNSLALFVSVLLGLPQYHSCSKTESKSNVLISRYYTAV